MKKQIVVFSGNGCAPQRQSYFYNLAYQTGKLLAQEGYTTVTGGGPGLMNETMHGAWDGGGETVGICLEQFHAGHSSFITTKEQFALLGPRQDRLLALGDAFIALPGGIGTLYEICAVLALKRKGECDVSKPMILLGPYYDTLHPFFESMRVEGFVNNEFTTLFQLAATPQEAIQLLQASKS